MSVLDVEQLLEPISPDAPCGENLEYDADFGELERAAQGAAEQQFGSTVVEAQEPDWKDVRKRALDLLTRTKDLRVVVYLARAVVRLDGLPGFRDALAVLRGLVEKYWQEVHPQLDPEDDNDPALRVNALAALCDKDACLKAVLEAPMVESSALGKFSYRDYMVASGDMPPRQGENPTEMATIDSAFQDADPDGLIERGGLMAGAVADADGLESSLTAAVGVQNSASFDPLTDLLKKISKVLSEQLGRRGLGGQDAPEASAEVVEDELNVDVDGLNAMIERSGTESNGRPAVAADEVRCRDDVIRLIDKICEYYSENEPSSPVPMLLKRARRIATMDFMELLRELAPSGVSEAELIGGAANASSSEES